VTLPQQALSLTLPQNTPAPLPHLVDSHQSDHAKREALWHIYKMMMMLPWNFKLDENVNVVEISEKEYPSPLINNFCWTSQALTPSLSHILHHVIIQDYTTYKKPTV